MRSRSSTHLGFTLLAAILTACSGPLPHRHIAGADDVECGVVASANDERCFARTPEVSKEPPYTLHFIEFDDQGWLYPDTNADGYVKEMGAAHGQLDRAVADVRSQLDDGKRVLLLVYVHGWKHSAAHDDRDVRRFRQMLADAAYLDEKRPTAEDASKRRVVGIYVGWRGAGRFSAENPLVYLSFWSRKNAALHVSEGAARELFGRLRALRERVNHEDVRRPPLRTVVIGHSFGAWVVFSALSPSLLELLASPVDAARDASSAAARSAWRRARLRQAADIVVLVNPAFEASRYQPVHHLAQRLKLADYEPPVLLLVTSTADRATRQLFPVGRFVNTIFQHPFVSDEQERATKHTPGFMDLYQTHSLTREPSAQVAECSGWADSPLDVAGPNGPDVSAESEAARIERLKINASLEARRHAAWRNYVAAHPGGLPPDWEWRYCGGAFIRHKAALNPGSLVWNVLTDDTLVRDHSDIMREPLHAFLRQLYLDLPR
ncbi:hypothetical protein [Aromatoleum diolicum]|uniref:Esterase n=1 Tax=Aromatoleum diolicum TaxID=75796 RepID=A0ABX1QCV9_9RHOO|nr:hypothetical protein [Aromatoleum diolicum]NMG76238.1 hypothetical protein [Aromatoleum diolicum]